MRLVDLFADSKLGPPATKATFRCGKNATLPRFAKTWGRAWLNFLCEEGQGALCLEAAVAIVSNIQPKGHGIASEVGLPAKLALLPLLWPMH